MHKLFRLLIIGICFSAVYSAKGEAINFDCYLLEDPAKSISISQVVDNPAFEKVQDVTIQENYS